MTELDRDWVRDAEVDMEFERVLCPPTLRGRSDLLVTVVGAGKGTLDVRAESSSALMSMLPTVSEAAYGLRPIETTKYRAARSKLTAVARRN